MNTPYYLIDEAALRQQNFAACALTHAAENFKVPAQSGLVDPYMQKQNEYGLPWVVEENPETVA